MSSRCRVLIVDDEANARGALAELLEDQGYHVDTAADGHDALERYEAFAPHAVITDIRMPNVSGIELVGRLRQNSADLVIIVVTACGGQCQQMVMRWGADGYLTKPVNIESLFQTLAMALDEARRPRCTNYR